MDCVIRRGNGIIHVHPAKRLIQKGLFLSCHGEQDITVRDSAGDSCVCADRALKRSGASGGVQLLRKGKQIMEQWFETAIVTAFWTFTALAAWQDLKWGSIHIGTFIVGGARGFSCRQEDLRLYRVLWAAGGQFVLRPMLFYGCWERPV